MATGGGVSGLYSDAIAADGFAHELANYGEYLGAPNEGQTHEYAKTISEFLHFPHVELQNLSILLVDLITRG